MHPFLERASRQPAPSTRAAPFVAAAHARVQTGLFETDHDVRNYDLSVDNEVNALDQALLASAKQKYGPDAYSATVTAAQKAQFDDDVAFFRSWRAFYDSWKAEHKSIQDTSFYVMSADEYRRIDAFAQDAKAWRARITARGVGITTPPITDRTPIGGSNPEATKPDPFGGATDFVKYVAIAIGVGGAVYLASTFMERSGPGAGAGAVAAG